MGHRWQGSSTAELMGRLEGRTETEAGVEGPESSWVQPRGGLPSKARSLTPDPVGRHALAPEALRCWEAPSGLRGLLGLPRWPGVRAEPPSGVQGCCSEQMWSQPSGAHFLIGAKDRPCSFHWAPAQGLAHRGASGNVCGIRAAPLTATGEKPLLVILTITGWVTFT